MRRLNARSYIIYLQRRIEDFGDPERPAPKWTERDREAVQEVVREFRELDRLHTQATEILRQHGLVIPLPVDAEFDEDVSGWDLIPVPPSKRRPWWRFW